MPHAIVVSMPIADRAASHHFYADGLGLKALGNPTVDGLPEPLQFVVNEGLHLMLIPTTGFSWGLADRPVAVAGQIEAQFTMVMDDDDDVRDLVRRVEEADGAVLIPPTDNETGYSSVLSDPDGHQWVIVARPWWRRL